MNTIVDECIYLRINELKNGKIQFTDSTNAGRLFREHGENIRYMAAWKKWLVWNGSRWETDESGALIHGKCLETVRNIYDDLAKTNDYRERIEIEKFAMISGSARRRKAAVEMVALTPGKNSYLKRSFSLYSLILFSESKARNPMTANKSTPAWA